MTEHKTLREDLRVLGLTNSDDFLCGRKVELLLRIANHVDSLEARIADAVYSARVECKDTIRKTTGDRLATLEKQLDLALPCWRTVEKAPEPDEAFPLTRNAKGQLECEIGALLDDPAPTADPVTSTAQPIPEPDYHSTLCQSCGSIRDTPVEHIPSTRAIAERCWENLKCGGMCCSASDAIAKFKDQHRGEAITRIASAIDEATKPLHVELDDVYAQRTDLRERLGASEVECVGLTAERDKLIDECNQWQEDCTALTAERDRLRGELDGSQLKEMTDETHGNLQTLNEMATGVIAAGDSVTGWAIGEIRRLKTGNDRLRGEVEAAREEHRKFVDDLSGSTIPLQDEIMRLRERVEVKEGELETMTKMMRKFADDLAECELRTHPTPIDPKQRSAVDEAELEDVARVLRETLSKTIGDGVTDIFEKQVTEITDTLRTVAGRGMLAVGEAEIVERFRSTLANLQGAQYGDWLIEKAASSVMRLLRERCAVVPGEGEIDDAIAEGWFYLRGPSEDREWDSSRAKRAVMRLITPPAKETRIENCMAFSNPDNIQTPCSGCGKAVAETSALDTESLGTWMCAACRKAKGAKPKEGGGV